MNLNLGQHWAAFAAAVLVSGTIACADRGEMYSDNRGDQTAAAPGGAAQENRKSMTVTGCFQEMSGPNNFVLSNVGDAPGVAPSATRAYRIEQGGDFEQYVGKKVSINGWVDADDANAAARSSTSGEPDFNDLPELHIDTIAVIGEACGAAR